MEFRIRVIGVITVNLILIKEKRNLVQAGQELELSKFELTEQNLLKSGVHEIHAGEMGLRELAGSYIHTYILYWNSLQQGFSVTIT